MGLKTKEKNFSLFSLANTFGVISPKIKINIVINPVAIPTAVPCEPGNRLTTKTVVKDEAKILTILFMIRMVVKY
jgi:hypothetical protein